MCIQTPNKIVPRPQSPSRSQFKHCFQDTLNPLCDCGNDTETITHIPRQTLLNDIRNTLTNRFYLTMKIS